MGFKLQKVNTLFRKKICKSLHNSKSRSIFAPHLKENAFPKEWKFG